MIDRNMQRFQRRLTRIKRMHASGAAFEATGTLGRSYYSATRPRARIRLPLRPLALILAAGLLFKAAILAQMGEEAYDLRVAALAGGTVAEQAGAWVLHADPATRWLSTFIQPLLR
jgi:hypothetical protein